MTYRGTVKKGVVVLEDASGLADGTEVTVRPTARKRVLKGKTAVKRATLKRGKGLAALAGKAKGLPADAARNLDHYLYGHPKR